MSTLGFHLTTSPNLIGKLIELILHSSHESSKINTSFRGFWPCFRSHSCCWLSQLTADLGGTYTSTSTLKLACVVVSFNLSWTTRQTVIGLSDYCSALKHWWFVDFDWNTSYLVIQANWYARIKNKSRAISAQCEPEKKWMIYTPSGKFECPWILSHKCSVFPHIPFCGMIKTSAVCSKDQLVNIFTNSLRGPRISYIGTKLDAYDVYVPTWGKVLRLDVVAILLDMILYYSDMILFSSFLSRSLDPYP